MSTSASSPSNLSLLIRQSLNEMPSVCVFNELADSPTNKKNWQIRLSSGQSDGTILMFHPHSAMAVNRGHKENISHQTPGYKLQDQLTPRVCA